MLKKIFFSILCLILFTGSYESGKSFLGDEFSLNMYENIDEGIDDLEESIYKKQLKTNRGGNIVNIEDRVTELTNIEGIPDCFIEGSLSSTDIENIGNGRIDKPFEALSENCKIDDSIGIDFFFDNYVDTIRELDEESRRIAEEQSKVISETARVGIYSDGNDQNSPFDLIVDLQDINNIIFSTEIPFEGVNSESNNDIFECLAQKFEGVSDDLVASIEGSISSRDDAYLECETFSASQNYGENFELEGLAEGVAGGQTGDEQIDFFGTASDGNNLVCQDSTIHSGLSPEAIEGLIESTGAGRDVIPISTFLPEITVDENGNIEESEVQEYPTTEYQTVKDNDMWPCTEFFCIRTDFVTKNYDLLTGGKTNSIEAIIERSNGHLKKAANSILVQSKVTTNNFEMGWRDLSLPDMFHAGVQIQFAPPPILNLDQVNGDNEEESNALGEDFSLDYLLYSYFKDANLDYLKQNDLEKFKQVEIDRKTTLAGQELTTDRLLQSFEETRELVDGYKTEVNRSILDKKVNNEDLSDFDAQFAEIERFSGAIKDYSIAASSIIQKMKEIPIFTNG